MTSVDLYNNGSMTKPEQKLLLAQPPALPPADRKMVLLSSIGFTLEQLFKVQAASAQDTKFDTSKTTKQTVFKSDSIALFMAYSTMLDLTKM